MKNSDIYIPRTDKSDEKTYWRYYFFIALMALAMLMLIIRLFQLQVINAAYYRQKSIINQVLEIPLKAPRGDIYDRNGVKLARNHQQYDLYLSTTGDNVSDLQHLESLAKLTKLNPNEIESAKNRLTKAAGEAPVLLKSDITLGLVIELKEKYDDYPFAFVDRSPKRSYPHGELTSHIVGYLREIDEGKLKELKGAGYAAGDLVGWSGIERQYDANLRGRIGRKLMEVDHHGNWMGLMKKWEENDKGEWILVDQLYPPEKGNDLRLSIDIELQKRIAFELGKNVGGVAVMDVNTGEILAMYSYPTFDANLFSGPVTSVDWNEIVNDPQHPLQNRLMQNAYPPGSIIKPVIAISGFLNGVLQPQTAVICRGVLKVGNRDFKCWRAGGHGTVSIQTAIAQSCDVFFYTIGERLGIDRITKTGKALGLGLDTDIDLAEEKSGFIPSPEWKLKRYKQKWFTGDTVNLSIGQGFLQVTPLQMLRICAFFANGGKLVNPHLNMAVMSKVETPEELKNLDPSYLKIIKDGMRSAVVSGTARGCLIKDVPVAGKTGTADDPPRRKPHSWFISFAPSDNPRVAMVVFGQNGGHSDELAVPIARKIYESPEMRKYIFPSETVKK